MIETMCCLEHHTVLESCFPAVRLEVVSLTSFVNFQNQQSESLHRPCKLVGHVYLGVKKGATVSTGLESILKTSCFTVFTTWLLARNRFQGTVCIYQDLIAPPKQRIHCHSKFRSTPTLLFLLFIKHFRRLAVSQSSPPTCCASATNTSPSPHPAAS